MDPRKQYEAFLEYQIAALEAEMAAWQPGWAVPALEKSFADACAYAAVAGVWEGEIDGLYAARDKALADHAYGVDKIQHLYL